MRKLGKELFLLLLITVLLFVACASGPETTIFSGPVGSGDSLSFKSIKMTAPDNWEDYAALAKFVPGTIEANVEAIEFQIGYGETTIAWNFDGFTPGETVRISHDVNVDLFGTETSLAFSYLTGTYTAEDGLDPRDDVNDAIRFKWADSEPAYSDTTNGWQTVSYDILADKEGAVSVLMILGRAANDPPVVFGYFTNPIATAVK